MDNPVIQQLRTARADSIREINQIDRAITALTNPTTPTPGRHFSAATRRRMSQAQKARWAMRLPVIKR
jgi:hypothetical protein